MATVSRFSAVVRLGRLHFEGLIAWTMWLAVHLLSIVGFTSRVTIVLRWLLSLIGRGRAQWVATQQQVYGRLALEHLGPRFAPSMSGGHTVVTRPRDEGRAGSRAQPAFERRAPHHVAPQDARELQEARPMQCSPLREARHMTSQTAGRGG